uniref:N-acetyltransferase domain-containing protein n=1 Tax=Clastoptera arizonana TaxID=38151 RepID=A0A1B6CTI9_9HEMI
MATITDLEISCFRCRSSNSMLYNCKPDFNTINYSISIELLNCTVCNICVSIKIRDSWKYIEDILSNKTKKDGWQILDGLNDVAAYYLLSQIFYHQHDSPKTELCEATYDIPDKSDIIKLLWHQNKAVGFYTVKPKGSEAHYSTYNMTTLDTAYIRKSHRRQGFALNLIHDLLFSWPGNIGFSTPISIAMWKVLEKFLMLHENYKYLLWEVEGTGEEGSRKLIWFCLKKRNYCIRQD